MAFATALDLPLDDLELHQLGGCCLTTLCLTDVGIVGLTRQSKKAVRSKTWAQDDVTEDILLQLDPEDAQALEQLGLPASFGSSKNSSASQPRRRKTKRTAAQEQQQATELPRVFEDDPSAQQANQPISSPPLATEWEQGYDHETGYYFYYRTSTNETQWMPPAEGYRPLRYPGPIDETGQAEVAAESQHKAAREAGAQPDPGLVADVCTAGTSADAQQAPGSLRDDDSQGAGEQLAALVLPDACAATLHHARAVDQLDAEMVAATLSESAAASPEAALQLEAIARDALSHTVGLDPGASDPPSGSTAGPQPQGASADLEGQRQTCALASGSHEEAAFATASSISPARSAKGGNATAVISSASPGGSAGAHVHSIASSALQPGQAGQQVLRFVPVGAEARLQVPRKVYKYWLQRYSLFSRFDEGIQMDQEGWFSVTPEVLAAACAQRCKGAVVLDAFAGVGGNSIQFAHVCPHVIALDICQERLELAQHNAGVYGVAGRIDFVCGDFFRLAYLLKVDIVFLSPPWGGPSYGYADVFDIDGDPFGLGVTLQGLLDMAWRAVSSHSKAPGVVCFLPRNTDLQQLASVMPSDIYCEVERNVLNGYLKAITVYIGEVFRE